jgi:hypothetical protein
MQVARVIVAALYGLISFNSMANEVVEREPVAIVDSHRLPTPKDAHISLKGRIELGQPYRVRIDTSPQSVRLVIRASLDEANLGEIALDLTRYPEMEVMPVLGVGPEGVELIFRFGDHRTQCFVNDDGRDRVTIWFHKSRRPTTSVTSFENCLGQESPGGY